VTSRAGVLGAGSWGTTLALHLARKGIAVSLWDLDGEHLARLSAERENVRHVPGEAFPESLSVVRNMEEAAGLPVVVLAIPTTGMREAARAVKAAFPQWSALPVSVAKGLEYPGARRMSEVLKETLPPAAAARVTVLAGPSLAREVARGLPVSLVAAGLEADAREVQELFSGPSMRVYTNTDVIGVELGGAFKNIIAIAAGLMDGLELGDNAKGALLARGLAEMVRLGEALGARPESFYGLCGVGDLVATSTSDLSRNHQVGIALARGRRLDDILGDLGMAAEGVPATLAALEMSSRLGVELPITREVHAVMFSGKDPRDALEDLMNRGLKPEFKPA
jgi:glycerol-3-phosphate dehydrogenase (NAD(P)+)